jgi:hypothetical protein
LSVSIYYTAVRARRLDDAERANVAAIRQRYSVNDRIERYLQTGEGMNWSSFTLYDPPHTPDAVIEGATPLPDNSENATWVGVRHWCAALSELRRAIPDAVWHVHVEDHDVHWDEAEHAYDPTK